MATNVVSNVKLSPEKQNYIKAQLALDYTRTGLKDFVHDGINALHQTIMQNLSQRTPCTACTITNVVPCPTRGFCRGRPCQTHSTSPCRQCPNNFCNSFMSEIRNAHSRHEPTWQNTDSKSWSTDPWQMAKCFCPPGFDKYASADDTDLPGLIHIITNCTAFQAQIAENLDAKGNTFHQVRDSRNQINHSSTMEMPETVLWDHIDKMIDILEDQRFLISHAPAVEAIEKLEKLKNEPLLVTRAEARQMKMEAEQKYTEDKKRLQYHLTEQYLTLYSNISLSPLVSEIVANFDDISVPQSMKQVKLSHETEHEGKQQERPDVKSYDDIFNRNSQACKNIYIKGEPGTGKSFLSQRIALSWSKFMKGEPLKDDEDFIKRFSFLFYISLRHTRGENNLDEMILKHPLLENKEFDDLITRILRDESSECLIVVDGLDEWSSTQTTATLGVSKGLPLRDVTRRGTILTTTRPWKLETIRMATTEIDQLIELTGLDRQSSEKYIASLVQRLNQRFGRDKTAADFIKKLKSHKLGAFMTLPVLLKYLVCLWHAGKPIGNSQCEIYSGLLDLLLQLPEKESACRNETLESLKQTFPAVNFPSSFNGKHNCQLFGSLLQRLSKLAFHTLFAENQESSLVFDSSSAEIHGMSKTDIQACLNIGILSQDIVMQQCANPEMSLSFLHKTFQEFLAAVYVYTIPDQTDGIYTTVSEYCSSVERVLEVSKMLEFMSGICPAMVSRLSEHVARVVSGDARVRTYRQNAGTLYPEYNEHRDICESIQHRMADCIKEAQCAGLGQDLNIYIQDVILQHSLVTENVQQLIQNSSGHLKSICTKGSRYLDSIQHVTQVGVLERLEVRGDDIGGPLVLSRLSSIIQQYRNSIKCLVLKHITCTDLPLETLSQLFGGLSHLEAIMLEYITLSHDQYVWLMKYLSHRTKLREIDLPQLDCIDDKSNEPSQCTAVSESSYGPLDLRSHTQLTSLNLGRIYTDHIQLPTSCPQLTLLKLVGLHSDHIHIGLHVPNFYPQLTTLVLFQVDVDCILLPTSCPQLITLVLYAIRTDRLQMPTSCPQLTTLQLMELHVDCTQPPTDMSHLQTCMLSNIHTRGVTVPVLQALRHSSHLHGLAVVPSKAEIPEVTDTVIEVLPTLHHIRIIKLGELHIGGRQLRLSPLMAHLKQVQLVGVTLSRKSLHDFIDSIVEIPHTLEVELQHIIITPDTDTNSALDYIRSSSSCAVTTDETDEIMFRTTDRPDLNTDDYDFELIGCVLI